MLSLGRRSRITLALIVQAKTIFFPVYLRLRFNGIDISFFGSNAILPLFK
ncbi:MAG: hypothetical protein KUG71_02145 [Porticoccaceae bacterium]|nr:hypothetical protein [Porticoccaceae bacterium]